MTYFTKIININIRPLFYSISRKPTLRIAKIQGIACIIPCIGRGRGRARRPSSTTRARTGRRAHGLANISRFSNAPCISRIEKKFAWFCPKFSALYTSIYGSYKTQKKSFISTHSLVEIYNSQAYQEEVISFWTGDHIINNGSTWRVCGASILVPLEQSGGNKTIFISTNELELELELHSVV